MILVTVETVVTVVRVVTVVTVVPVVIIVTVVSEKTLVAKKITIFVKKIFPSFFFFFLFTKKCNKKLRNLTYDETQNIKL